MAVNAAKLPTNGFRRGPPSSRGVDELPAEPNARPVCALHPNFCRLNPLNKWLRPLALVNPLEFAPVDPALGAQNLVPTRRTAGVDPERALKIGPMNGR